ncbi:MAG TPA: methionine--tRNA ligase [Actinobacteria bacterium]|nr:methionine--tRNA ligase [Actinomycetota bacterium]
MSAARKILVAVAWPYASGSRHLGHLAGAYLPADVFARYHRAVGNDVLMVSGSDVHGTPITVRAEAEGVSPQEIVARYHAEIVENWKQLGFSWDLYTTTGTETHERVVQEFFLTLLDKGYLYKKTTDQFYDEEAGRFLPDRYVEGTCPHCGYPEARGDQCDGCGRTLDPTDLVEPRSKLTGSRPVLRPTEHYYWRLSAFQEPLLEWLRTREGWRPHVINFAIGMVEEGLHDRAFTRDLDWGIPVPVDDLGPGKVIYVWWEAVMGYYSAPQEWAELRGDPDAWKAWWTNPEAESYYFVGKDNIPFHAVYWPALLMGHGGLNLPTNVPANQYLTFGGEKGSASRGVGRSIGWYLERMQPDALRYAVASVFPETHDTDLSDAEIVRRVNEELVATWGNLVNRVLSMVHRYFDGVVPERRGLDDADRAVLAEVDATLADAGRLIEEVRLQPALRRLMAGAQAVNQYLSERRPWQTAKDDLPRTGTTLAVALEAIAGLAAGLAPYLPFSSCRIHELVGLEVPDHGPRWERPTIPSGVRLGPVEPLFAKLEALDDAEG